MLQKLSNLQFGLIVTFNRNLKQVSLVLLPAKICQIFCIKLKIWFSKALSYNIC